MVSPKFAADVAAINEFRETLGEESLSELHLNENAVKFSVQAADNPNFIFKIGAEYPRGSAQLICSTSTSLDLATINMKLEGNCGVSRALSLLGRQLKIDLEWVVEALANEDSQSESDNDMADGNEAEVDEDDFMGGDDMSGHEDDLGDEMIRDWSHRLVHMEAIEAEARRAETEADEDAAAFHAEKQIFDPRAAYQRLVNELGEIFKAQDYNLMADAAGPLGLFQWEVSLAGFRPDSGLAGDLQQAGRKYGVSSVQLQMNFKRGLHPFYPPSVQVLSPRFQGCAMGAVACFPILKAEHWDPLLSAKEVVMKIKEFLENNARVDLGTNQQGYHPTEQLLVRLQALTGAQPADSTASPDVVYAEAFEALVGGSPSTSEPVDLAARSPVNKKLRAEVPEEAKVGAEVDPRTAKEKEVKKLAWKAGVGYGHGRSAGSGQVWDARRTEALQAARDAEACDVLQSLAEETRSGLDTPSDPVDHPRLVAALRSGCLVPLLVQELSSAGFQDMNARVEYYHALLQCIDAMARPELVEMLTWHAATDTRCLASALKRLRAQASTFLHVLRQAEQIEVGQEADQDSKLADYLLQVADKVTLLVPVVDTIVSPPVAPQGPATRSRRQAAASASASHFAATAAGAAPEQLPEDPDERYIAVLSPFKLAVISGVSASHSYKEMSEREPTAPSRTRARRVASELASMESDLPVTSSSSVFVVADEQQTVLWKAIITGPRDTPYEGGCFLFDIYFPNDYPQRPPNVKIRTTGGGTVRFNPNLYNCGKVCLSLLGTWAGDKGESWSPDYSSILQVLVSIQSLILCDQPFYNEPGYESRPDEKESNRYSATVMEETVRWAMLDQLRSPPAYFAEAIRAHFRERGDAVLETVRRWEAWCREKGHKAQAAAIQKMLPGLEVEINKLRI